MQKMVRTLFEQGRNFGSKVGTPLVAVCALAAVSVLRSAVREPMMHACAVR